jgi:hypothetical protein
MAAPDPSGGRWKTVEPNRLLTTRPAVLPHHLAGRSIQEAIVAIATAPAREILEDRWEGLTTDSADEWTKLMLQTDKLLTRYYEGLTRSEWTGHVAASRDFPGSDGSGDVTGAVHAAIRRTFLEAIEKAEVALREYPAEKAEAAA